MGASRPIRIQGAWVEDDEIASTVYEAKTLHAADFRDDVFSPDTATARLAGQRVPDDEAGLILEAARLVVATQLGSTSMLQRKLRVGYTKAGRLMDALEVRKIVGPVVKGRERAVLVPDTEIDRVGELVGSR
jgi:S-DNA-T family DNA segregation ATPase FtsK/SpoIIIE